MSAPKKTKIISVTKKVYWKVPQFSKDFFEGKKPGDYINSEIFTISVGDVSTRWYFDLCPNGNREENKSNVSLYLCSRSAKEENYVDFKVNYKLGVATNERSNDYVIEVGERSKEQMTEGIGFHDFLTHADLFDTKNGFVVDGELSVFADLKLEIEVETLKPKPKVPLSVSSPFADYKKMFENEALSDFQLETNDNNVLKTHRFVLAARSPVFFAMLTTDMEEQYKGSVKVPDFDSIVMKELLRFIYYNEVENLDEIAPNLIYAAEKYQLKELKVMCLQEMLSSLELKTAVEFLKIAYEVSGANDLFEKCVEMIENNYSEVLQNPSWKDLPKELMSKLFEKSCRKRSRLDI